MRKAGWYWVINEDLAKGWIAAEWKDEWGDGDLFWCGCGEGFDDDQCQKIGPRIPTPDEPWQTVPIEPTREMLREAATSDGATDEVAIGYGMASAAYDWNLMLAAAPKP